MLEAMRRSGERRRRRLDMTLLPRARMCLLLRKAVDLMNERLGGG